MTELRRIGILLFLYTRNELSPSEMKELESWRKNDPENEKLFFEMTDPASLRREIQAYYSERDRDFKKLQVLMPELAGTSLTGSVEEAVRIFSETPEPEKSNPLSQADSEYSKSGLSPLTYWESKISGLDDDEPEDKQVDEFAKPKKGKIKLFWKLTAVAAISFMLWILDGVLSGSDSHTEVMMITPEGVRFKVTDFEQGKQAGLAGIRFGKTETGENIYIVSDQSKKKKDAFYTLMSASGGEFLLQLPDDSRVWINAATTIRYPANFSQDTIWLEVDGEAYVEVSKGAGHLYVVRRLTPNAQRPTHNAGPLTLNTQTETCVLQPGARFDFNTYAGNDESLMTVISGPSVQLDSDTGNKMQLLAGMQALTKNDFPVKTRSIDTTQIIAWKNGELYYKDATLPEMMPAIAKWYDVEIKYVGTMPDKKFSLRVPRSADVAEVIDMLQKQGLHIVKIKKQVTIMF